MEKCVRCPFKKECGVWKKLIDQEKLLLEILSTMEDWTDKIEEYFDVGGGEMYNIDCILAEKFAPNGSPIRMKTVQKLTLNSEKGVQRFIDEMKPFHKINIRYLGNDVTDEFLSQN